MPSTEGTTPAGLRSHSARSAARPRARAADSGYVKSAAGAGVVRRAEGTPSAERIAASTGLSVEPARERPRDPRCHVLRARLRRRHEEHDHRVDRRILEDDREHRLVAGGGRRAEHVDGVGEARLGGQQLRQRCIRLGRELGELEARPSRTRPRRGCRGRRHSSGWPPFAPVAAAASRAARPRRSAPRASVRARRLPGGRAPRPPRPSLRAPRCASRRPALPRSRSRSSSRGSASFAPPGPRSARTAADCRTTRGRARSARCSDPLPSTRGGRSRRRPPCFRSR